MLCAILDLALTHFAALKRASAPLCGKTRALLPCATPPKLALCGLPSLQAWLLPLPSGVLLGLSRGPCALPSCPRPISSLRSPFPSASPPSRLGHLVPSWAPAKQEPETPREGQVGDAGTCPQTLSLFPAVRKVVFFFSQTQWRSLLLLGFPISSLVFKITNQLAIQQATRRAYPGRAHRVHWPLLASLPQIQQVQLEACQFLKLSPPSMSSMSRDLLGREPSHAPSPFPLPRFSIQLEFSVIKIIPRPSLVPQSCLL
jgi:hypothetical protein